MTDKTNGSGDDYRPYTQESGFGPFLDEKGFVCIVPDLCVEPFPPISTDPPDKSQFSKGTNVRHVASSGRSNQFTDGFQVTLMFWGKYRTFSEEEFRENASKFRNRLLMEADSQIVGIQDWYDFHSSLQGQWLVSVIVSLFRRERLPSLSGLIDLIGRLKKVHRVIASTIPIEADVLLEQGEELQAIRSEEIMVVRRLNGQLKESASTAGTIASGLDITQEVAFGVLKLGNKLYAFNNPFREALGQLVILSLQGIGTGAGQAIAYKDWAHVRDSLIALAKKEFPSILVDLIMGVLGKSLGTFKTISAERAKKCTLIFIEVELLFVFDLVLQSIEDDSKLTQDWVINKMLKTTETALVEMVAVLLGLEDQIKKPAVRQKVLDVAHIVLAAVVDSAFDTLLQARTKAKKENRPLGEVVLASIPGMLVKMAQSLLTGLLSLKIKNKWDNEDLLKKEWEQHRGQARDTMSKIKKAARILAPKRPDAEAAPLKETDRSVSPIGSSRVVDKSESNEHIRKEIVHGKPKRVGKIVSQEHWSMFKGHGLTRKKLAEKPGGSQVLEEMEKALLASDYQGGDKWKGTPADWRKKELDNFLASSLTIPSRVAIDPGEKLFTLRAIDTDGNSKAPYSRGYYLTKAQLDAVIRNPHSARIGLLALPLQSQSPVHKYHVYEIEAMAPATGFASELASTSQENILQMGGRVHYKGQKSGQIWIPNGGLKNDPFFSASEQVSSSGQPLVVEVEVQVKSSLGFIPRVIEGGISDDE